MDVIAEETAFADSDRMRRAFLRTLGQPPQAIRRNARESAMASSIGNEAPLTALDNWQ